nr:PREDICTED: uncharacterized protein LOC106704640 [Latimeria chalumnae]|eukprot:XP_014347593.1 PREDICTED: uncharacterized protein LOC106704640 [Latimeria chalumnae]
MSEREIQNGNASLSIPKVTPADEGDYKCFVLYTLDKEEKTIRLKVEAVPKVAVSESLMNKDKVSVLTCEARGHYPKNITVEWRSGGQVQTGSILVTGENKDNTFNTINTYIFTSSEQDPGKTYSCHVCHISLKEPIQEDLILRLLDGDLTVQEHKSGLIRAVILAVLIPVVIIGIVWLIWRRRYISEISFSQKYTLGQEASITANLSYLYEQNITAKWWLSGPGDSLVEINEREQAMSESLPLIMNEECVMSFTNEKAQNWPMKLLTSRLSYKPQVEEVGCVFICRFYRDGKEIPHTSQRTHSILIFARPEVSDIKEVPLSTEDEVKFTVDVSKFYPEEIQIHWSLNGKQLKETTSEPHRNVDGTYSVTNQIVIPEGELKEKDQIKVIIEHKSMEKSAVKEKTLQDPGPRTTSVRGEMPLPLLHRAGGGGTGPMAAPPGGPDGAGGVPRLAFAPPPPPPPALPGQPGRGHGRSSNILLSSGGSPSCF